MSLRWGLSIGMASACSRPSITRLLPFELIRILHKSPHSKSQTTLNSPSPESKPTPTFAPKKSRLPKNVQLDPELYYENTKGRKYIPQSAYPARIKKLFEDCEGYKREARPHRERRNTIQDYIKNPTKLRDEDSEFKGMSKEQLIEL